MSMLRIITLTTSKFAWLQIVVLIVQLALGSQHSPRKSCLTQVILFFHPNHDPVREQNKNYFSLKTNSISPPLFTIIIQQ